MILDFHCRLDLTGLHAPLNVDNTIKNIVYELTLDIHKLGVELGRSDFSDPYGQKTTGIIR